jgi:hypothetical protein
MSFTNMDKSIQDTYITGLYKILTGFGKSIINSE